MAQRSNKFVRNESDKRRGIIFPFTEAIRCAVSGLLYVVKTQRNVKIHSIVSALALALGFALSLPLSSWLAVIVCMGLVFGAECLNTAVESMVDLISPEYDELAKHAKDCAAAAVLVCAATSLVVGVCVYGGAVVNMVAPELLGL